jgi:hypothetical protein
VKPSLFTELRDWLDSLLTLVFGYLAWRWRPRKSRDVTIKVPPATASAVMPTPAILTLSPVHATSSASLALTTGNDAGTQAALDSMAEVFPYEFPPN